MKQITINISELKLVNGSRVHTKEQVELYKNLIKNYNQYIPLIIDNNNFVVGEPARYIALRELEIKEVECYRIENLSEEDIEIIRIGESRAAELGQWDFEKLYEELKLLGDKSYLTGFDTEEVKALIEEELERCENIEEMETPEVEILKEPFTKQGDLWLLGEHKVLCGDSTSKEDAKRLMNGKMAKLCITDPPYNINYESEDGKKIINDNMSSKEFYNFLLGFYKNMHKYLISGGAFYIFHADSETEAFRGALEEAKLKISQCLIWVKNGFNLSRQDYNWRHEPILYGWKEGAAHYFIKDYTQDTVLELPVELKSMSKKELREHILELNKLLEEYSTIIKEDKPIRNDVHPTMKPLKLLARLILNNTKPKDLVVDWFGGSGSTLMSCDQIDRTAYLMEFDPKYVDVEVKRYAMTKENITLVRDGKEYSWEEVRENFKD